MAFTITHSLVFSKLDLKVAFAVPTSLFQTPNCECCLYAAVVVFLGSRK